VDKLIAFVKEHPMEGFIVNTTPDNGLVKGRLVIALLNKKVENISVYEFYKNSYGHYNKYF
jgi:hypothetical protein